jgi:hypothetical protein
MKPNHENRDGRDGRFKFARGGVRILILPCQWEWVKQYCFHHLGNQEDVELRAAQKMDSAMTLEQALAFASE